MGTLPQMMYGSGIKKFAQVKFGGLNHNLSAGDGEIWDMENLCSDHYPLLSPRQSRWLIATLAKPNGFYAGDGLFWADGEGFFADGERVGTVADSRKHFVSMGAFLIILPDKAYYNRLTGEFGALEARWNGAVTVRDGTIYGEAAMANTLCAAGANWESLFAPGDAVQLSGFAVHPENNLSLVIREIDGDELRFYENSFVADDGGDAEVNVTVSRSMPDMDFLCANENRLWGCKGDQIFGSKLGDIKNWNVFDGLSTDSYAVTVGSAGDFTGAFSYLGYPCFFKENSIHKVYGSRPANFQVMSSASLGIEAGSDRSPGIAGETLFYLSRVGVVAYSGGLPQSVAAPFGTERYRDAVGGSDGTKYYVSMRDAGGNYQLFVYDTRFGLWHREDSLEVLDFGWDGELYFLSADGKLWMNGNARTVPEEAQSEGEVPSACEFGDFVEGQPNEKGTAKLQLRLEIDAGGSVDVDMRFDSRGPWRHVYRLRPRKKRSYYLPIIPRRSDHFRIRLKGTGGWRLYSLVRENYVGSEMKGS